MSVTRRWTTADVRAIMREDRAWPRYELIDGELIVTPSPRSPHQIAAGELYFLLHGYLDRKEIAIAMMSPSDLELRPGTITQPDVFVIPTSVTIADDVREWSGVKVLLLAIEILSPSSVRYDRVVKRDLYLTSGVAEYWIVDLDARMVERWRPTQETPEILHESIEWTLAGHDPLRIDLTTLFERVDTNSLEFERWARGRGRALRRDGPASVDGT